MKMYGNMIRWGKTFCLLTLLVLLVFCSPALAAAPEPTPAPLIVGDWQVEPCYLPADAEQEEEAAEAEPAEEEAAAEQAEEKPEALCLVKYLGQDAELELPEELTLSFAEGEAAVTLPVVEIGDNVFRDNRRLTKVYIPDCIMTIGEGAFYNCTALTEARLPQKIEKLETDLFYGCRSLKGISIPETVTNIGYGCFEGCDSFEQVVLPESVDTVRGNAFKDCRNLEEVTLSRRLGSMGGHVFQNTPWLKAQKDEFVIVGDNILLRYNGKDREVTIPEGTQLIVDAFENNRQVEVVHLNEDLKRIGSNAFAGCRLIETMDLPESLRAVDENGFAYCDNLKSLVLPEGMSYIGSEAFRNCYILQELVIPASVTEIGSRAFQGCRRLTELVVPDGVQEIGSGTFANCRDLANVSLPMSIVRVAETAFNGSRNVQLQVVYDSASEHFAKEKEIPYTYMIQYNDEYAYVRDPEGIELIKYMGVSSVVDVPETIDDIPVYAIGAGAFQEAARLVEVSLPASVTKISGWAFSYLEQLESVILPAQVKSLGADAFRGCTGLLEVFLPDSVEELGADVFADCSQLVILADTGSFASAQAQQMNIATYDPLLTGSDYTYEKREGTLALTGYTGSQARVALPETRTRRDVTVIAADAFKANAVIAEVIIPDGYTAIESGAFAGIAQPVTLVIPDSLLVLEDGAFEGSAAITLKAHVGTAAEAYARQNGLKFLVIHE